MLKTKAKAFGAGRPSWPLPTLFGGNCPHDGTEQNQSEIVTCPYEKEQDPETGYDDAEHLEAAGSLWNAPDFGFVQLQTAQPWSFAICGRPRAR